MNAQNEDTKAGFLFALGAYAVWGVLPFLLKTLAHIPVIEVLAHRVMWSVPIAAAVLVILGRTADIRAALTNGPMLRMAALTATLISINWGTYVWSITSGQALQAALGYYINPLLAVFLGAVLLKESLTRSQLVAIALATLAVIIIAVDAGGVPWASLVMTFSWGFYAMFRRTLPIGPNQGFLLEVVILSPAALCWIIWTYMNGTSHFGPTGLGDIVLLISMGFATAGPLMLYANGAKQLRLSTIGMMQYLAPTAIFLIAVFVFREPFPPARAFAFGLIWIALIIFSVPIYRQWRRGKAKAARKQ